MNKQVRTKWVLLNPRCKFHRGHIMEEDGREIMDRQSGWRSIGRHHAEVKHRHRYRVILFFWSAKDPL